MKKGSGIVAFALLGFVLTACGQPLPEQRFSQFRLSVDYRFSDQGLELELENPLRAPVRIWVRSEDRKLKRALKRLNPLVLASESDTLLSLEVRAIRERKLGFDIRLGDPSQPVRGGNLSLPFPKGRSYEVVQGYGGSFSHRTDWSRYALDFTLKVGDTICSAAEGYVVGVIDGYIHGGPDERWKPYANFITLFHPDRGLFTQYVHLKHLGSLVSVGDRVREGQPIGLSGQTGQTTTPHLHFNCLQPSTDEDGLISIPIDSLGDYKARQLFSGSVVAH